MAWNGQAISELSAENGVALVNAYGLTIGESLFTLFASLTYAYHYLKYFLQYCLQRAEKCTNCST